MLYLRRRLTCVPEAEVERFPVHHDAVSVVVEHCGDVVGGEGVGCVGNQETRLSHCSVSHRYHLQVLHLHARNVAIRSMHAVGENRFYTQAS